MSRNHHAPTPALRDQVASFIRAGGMPEVAAEAAGVPPAAFREWLRRGEGPRAPRAYRDFAAAVRQAHATSRLSAEVAVRDNKPLDWLRYGPGRDGPRMPGWGAAVKPRGEAEQRPSLGSPFAQELLRELLTALRPWPEVRASLAAKWWAKK